MQNGKRALGKWGEDIAARFLSRKGFRIIERNVKTYVGEIDIVARRKSCIIFVEIKTRKSIYFGPPYLAITKKKKKKLLPCALCYLKMKNILDSDWHIDVISIELDRSDGYIKKIEHFENAIDE